MSAIFDLIKKEIENNDVVLFMKGDSKFPQCGFSAVVCSILQKMNIPFRDINVLANNELREGIKLYSDWPTIPQLYIKQEFIGGCDIVREMYESGELAQLFKDKNIL